MMEKALKDAASPRNQRYDAAERIATKEADNRIV